MKMEKIEEENNWAVETEQLSYTYEGNEKKALDGVSLKLKKGRKIAFMGGNGSGKSTLFLCMNGILKPQEGKVRINGSPVEYTRKGLLDVRRKVGIVFQEPDDQLFSASVFQEISFGVLNLGVDEEKARSEVEQVIQELGITPFRDRPAHALSGGQKKLVAIADILVMHPKVLILDEPAASLDPKHRKLVRSIVEQLSKKGLTILMATHHVDYAYAWADEIVLLDGGRVPRQGTPRQVCGDEEAMEQANLELPAVLRLYRRMVQKGILSPEEEPPKTIEDLERRISG